MLACILPACWLRPHSHASRAVRSAQSGGDAKRPCAKTSLPKAAWWLGEAASFPVLSWHCPAACPQTPTSVVGFCRIPSCEVLPWVPMSWGHLMVSGCSNTTKWLIGDPGRATTTTGTSQIISAPGKPARLITVKSKGRSRRSWESWGSAGIKISAAIWGTVQQLP